jgi:two-component system nitrogen regulation sensor histidine kinase NtrY
MRDNIKLLRELDKTITIVFLNNSKEIFFSSDKEQLSRVFFNLIKNSIESIQQKTEKVSNFNKNITIELKDIGSHIILTINDNGIGFKNLNKNIKEILNPYFTTKKEGTGLGLSIVNKIVNDHSGNIEFIPKTDGAIIKIIFSK